MDLEEDVTVQLNLKDEDSRRFAEKCQQLDDLFAENEFLKTVQYQFEQIMVEKAADSEELKQQNIELAKETEGSTHELEVN